MGKLAVLITFGGFLGVIFGPGIYQDACNYQRQKLQRATDRKEYIKTQLGEISCYFSELEGELAAFPDNKIALIPLGPQSEVAVSYLSLTERVAELECTLDTNQRRISEETDDLNIDELIAPLYWSIAQAKRDLREIKVYADKWHTYGCFALDSTKERLIGFRGSKAQLDTLRQLRRQLAQAVKSEDYYAAYSAANEFDELYFNWSFERHAMETTLRCLKQFSGSNRERDELNKLRQAFIGNIAAQEFGAARDAYYDFLKVFFASRRNNP